MAFRRRNRPHLEGSPGNQDKYQPHLLREDEFSIFTPIRDLAGLQVGELPQSRFRITADGSVTPADGTIRPWVDLGARFGGWLADARFAEQRYRCFRGCTPAIAVTAPNFMRPVYLPSAATR